MSSFGRVKSKGGNDRGGDKGGDDGGSCGDGGVVDVKVVWMGGTESC